MSELKARKIAIIGAGSLGIAIAEGLVASGLFPAKQIMLTRRTLSALDCYKQQGYETTSDNLAAAQWADMVFLCVKPKQAKETVEGIAPALKLGKHVLVSVMTGISLSELQHAAGLDLPTFRVMPNTAISVRESMTFISSSVSAASEEANINEIFNQLGLVQNIGEDLMAAATVLGSCGTAYALRYMRASTEGGVEIGFKADTALLIAAQTVKGAAALLIEKGNHPEHEIDKVTTPAGITIAGLNEMEHNGFSSAVMKGVAKSYQKMTGKS